MNTITIEKAGTVETLTIPDDAIDAVPDEGPSEWQPMALAICHKIESMGASQELTELSVMASELYQSLQRFDQYCKDSFERICRENPDLEPLLRGPTALPQPSKRRRSGGTMA